MPSSKVHWFVVAGSMSGDGSLERPFHDPWQAFRSAATGDVINVASGTYYGRYDRSSWIVDRPNLTVLGGYSQDFSKRTPWETPSVFAAFAGYEYSRENNLLSGRGDHSGFVLDGIFFDASGRNTYADEPVATLKSYPTMDGPIVSFSGKQVTIRNCVFANSANGGVEISGNDSLFENNLVINIVGIGMLDLRSAMDQTQPITVLNNTFCFAHDTGPPCGAGADEAIGIRINRPANIHDNIFISCGNAALSLYRDLDRVTIDRNSFYLTSRDILCSRAQGNSANLDEKNIEELEDVGFKSALNNVAEDPGLRELRAEWLDAHSRYLFSNYVKPPKDQINLLRYSAGLPTLTTKDVEKLEDKGAFAPRLSPADILTIRFQTKRGFHRTDPTVEKLSPPAREDRAYSPIKWDVITAPDISLSNKRVELCVGVGQEQNALLLSDAPPDTHMGIRIYRPGVDEGSIYVLTKRNALPARQFEETIKSNNGREVENEYLIRGVYRTDLDPNGSRQKVTIVVESIIPAHPSTGAQEDSTPAGRDWFVKAGSSGGDGSRDKPFRDPFQALDKAEGGDRIHVTAGAYVGKLRSGKWKIAIRNLTLLGGYDADFTERDPWKNATRFVMDAEERARGVPSGAILSSEENSDGLVLDGFVFDGASYNAYSESGALDVRNSPRDPLVDLRGGRNSITVRNCAFLNGSGAAINLSSTRGTFENNIVVNTSGWAIKIRGDGPGPWNIRSNTILFAADATDRAGSGKSSADGTLIHLNGRASTSITSNIFAFADNFGIRCTIPQQSVSFNGNIIAANLYNHLTDTQYLWADSSNWNRRAVADSAFASFRENRTDLQKLPIDLRFLDKALTRLFAIQSRISSNEWKLIAEQQGASVRPTMPEEATINIAEPVKAPPVASTPSSLNDLLASLKQMQTQIKEIETPKLSESKSQLPLYCPALEWNKGLNLAQATDIGCGAQRVHCEVAFSVSQIKPNVECLRVTAKDIDADHVALDSKAVELDVVEARSSAGNVSVYPAGLTSDSHDAYNVLAAGEISHTRLAILVRRDMSATKVLSRVQRTDRLRIRGTARIPANPNMLSLVADSVEIIEN